MLSWAAGQARPVSLALSLYTKQPLAAWLYISWTSTTTITSQYQTFTSMVRNFISFISIQSIIYLFKNITPQHNTPSHITPHHGHAWHYKDVFEDETEYGLEDLDFIPTENLFCENKYKKMVNI